MESVAEGSRYYDDESSTSSMDWRMSSSAFDSDWESNSESGSSSCTDSCRSDDLELEKELLALTREDDDECSHISNSHHDSSLSSLHALQPKDGQLFSKREYGRAAEETTLTAGEEANFASLSERENANIVRKETTNPEIGFCRATSTSTPTPRKERIM
jgi:hypothetical protein